MANSRVFCGGLPWATDDDELRSEMEQFGPVTDAKVITDRDTGRSKGFGFVTFADSKAAKEAVNVGTVSIDGRRVRIDEAQERERPRGGGGGGGGNGGGGWDSSRGGGESGKGEGGRGRRRSDRNWD